MLPETRSVRFPKRANLVQELTRMLTVHPYNLVNKRNIQWNIHRIFLVGGESKGDNFHSMIGVRRQCFIGGLMANHRLPHCPTGGHHVAAWEATKIWFNTHTGGHKNRPCDLPLTSATYYHPPCTWFLTYHHCVLVLLCVDHQVRGQADLTDPHVTTSCLPTTASVTATVTATATVDPSHVNAQTTTVIDVVNRHGDRQTPACERSS